MNPRYYDPTKTQLDALTLKAIVALGSGNSRSVFDWIAARARHNGARYNVSPRDCGQSLKRNADSGIIIRHGATAAAQHTAAYATRTF